MASLNHSWYNFLRSIHWQLLDFILDFVMLGSVVPAYFKWPPFSKICFVSFLSIDSLQLVNRLTQLTEVHSA